VSVVDPFGGTVSVHDAVDDEVFVNGAEFWSIVQSAGIGSTTKTVSAVFLALRSTISYALSNVTPSTM
jgi:hypothetical protein